jgi:hypothetical protein
MFCKGLDDPLFYVLRILREHGLDEPFLILLLASAIRWKKSFGSSSIQSNIVLT